MLRPACPIIPSAHPRSDARAIQKLFSGLPVAAEKTLLARVDEEQGNVDEDDDSRSTAAEGTMQVTVDMVESGAPPAGASQMPRSVEFLRMIFFPLTPSITAKRGKKIPDALFFLDEAIVGEIASRAQRADGIKAAQSREKGSQDGESRRTVLTLQLKGGSSLVITATPDSSSSNGVKEAASAIRASLARPRKTSPKPTRRTLTSISMPKMPIAPTTTPIKSNIRNTWKKDGKAISIPFHANHPHPTGNSNPTNNSEPPENANSANNANPATTAGDISSNIHHNANTAPEIKSVPSSPPLSPSSSIPTLPSPPSTPSANSTPIFTSLETQFISETAHCIPAPSEPDLKPNPDIISNSNAAAESRNNNKTKSTANNSTPPTMTINSINGIPVETDLFIGSVSLLIKPSTSSFSEFSQQYQYQQQQQQHIQNHHKQFASKKRRMEFQIQGKFKRKPQGLLCCGGEVTEKMKLGLVTRGLCNMLLKMLSKFSNGMHHSFGDDSEIAHIVFPAWSFFDRLVVSKPGEPIPPMGQPFEESEASIQARRSASSSGNGGSGGYYGEWNTTDTFSMSFNSMYLDLATWHLVNLPVTKDLDLHMFWGEGMLRLVMYEKLGEGRHVQKSLKYYLGVQIKFRGMDYQQENGSESENDGNDIVPWDKARPSLRKVCSYSELSQVDSAPEEQHDLNDSTHSPLSSFDDNEEFSDSDETLFYDAKSFTQESIIDWDTFPETTLPDSSSSLSDGNNNNNYEGDNICPGWIQFWKGKNKSNPNQKYATYFAVTLGDRVVFREWKQFQSPFSRQRRFDGFHIPSRASPWEKKRRVLGFLLAMAKAKDSLSEEDSLPMQGLIGKDASDCDKKFLRRSIDTVMRPVMKGHPAFFNFVARAKSERHWVEECVIVDRSYVSFHQPGQKYPVYRIHNEGIVSISPMDEHDCPHFPSYYFVSIEIVGRTTYLMFPDEDNRNQFIDAVSKHISRKSSDVMSKDSTGQELSIPTTPSIMSDNDLHLSLDDPAEEFLHKSSLWKCKQRRVFNCQKFLFQPFDYHGKSYVPCERVRDVLMMALELKDEMNRDKMLLFLRSAAELKGVSVRQLSETEKLAFFLNLYHVMVLHSFCVLGPPPNSVVKWASYFSMVSYQCCDDIFSIAELEHCIIRANMTSPSQFVSKFVLPKTIYHFALRKTDFRINFALNCGSISNPVGITVFDASKLMDQLEMTTELFVREFVRVSVTGKKCVVSLPRVCNWFNADFGKGQPSDIIITLDKYFRKEDRESCVKHSHNLKIKFQPYSFKCRQLTLLTPSE